MMMVDLPLPVLPIKAVVSPGCAVKLIARAVKTGDGVYLKTEPVAVRKTNPLCPIEDVFNGVLIRGTVSGDLMFFGRGAGKLPTAGAVVSDIIDIATHDGNQPGQQLWERDGSIYRDSLPAELRESSLKELGYPLF